MHLLLIYLPRTPETLICPSQLTYSSIHKSLSFTYREQATAHLLARRLEVTAAVVGRGRGGGVVFNFRTLGGFCSNQCTETHASAVKYPSAFFKNRISLNGKRKSHLALANSVVFINEISETYINPIHIMSSLTYFSYTNVYICSIWQIEVSFIVTCNSILCKPAYCSSLVV